MGDETVVGGYVLGETLGLGTLSEDDVAQVDTALNPDDNLYTVRFYGRDGELLQEQRLPMEWSETEFATIHEEDTPERDVQLGTNESWETEHSGLRFPHMVYDGDGLNYYGEDGELLWRADGVGMYAQGASSAEYHTALNMRDLWPTKGEWKTPEEGEQPDIQDERGGALDEFLDGFKPQKTTPKKEVMNQDEC